MSALSRADIEAWDTPKDWKESDLTKEAVEALVKRDAIGFLIGVNDPNYLWTVAKHVRLLKALGIFEKALTEAFTGMKINTRSLPLDYQAHLFESADPKTLRAVGKPLPGPGPFTLYRGVAGHGQARHIRGFSWTGSLGVAGWFAGRAELFGCKGPAVVRGVFPADSVLTYLPDARNEDEYLVRVPPKLRLERVPEDAWRSGAKRHEAAQVEKTKKRLEAARKMRA